MNDEPEFHQEIAGIQHEDNEPDTGAIQDDNDAEMDSQEGVANSHIVDAKDDEDESQQDSDSEQDEVESRQINPDRNDEESQSKIDDNEGSFHTANDKSVTPSSQVPK